MSFALLLLALSPLLAAPLWLNTSDTPENVDALVVLGGDFSRELYAAELYKKGMAPEIYVSQMAPGESILKISKLGVTLPSDKEVSASILLKSGVPAGSIHFYGPSISTYEEAASLKKVLPSDKRFVVVTSPYHVTRARLIFRQAFDSGRFRVVSTSENFPIAWWRHQRATRSVVMEILKLIHFEMGGAFTSRATHAF